jgi:primosomal protein N' (replication factor Y)
MDQDTTRGKNKHDTILNAFGKGKASILLGTQMIAKGLDFPNVTLVGVISADVGLSIPDFRSPERVFQLLTQVAGRSGRGDKFGEVVVQTYLPNHYAILLAKEHDYTSFYMQEIQHRKDYLYPPHIKMIQVLFSSPKSSNVIKYSRQTAVQLRRHGNNYATIYGPSPAMVSRIQNNFRWQLSIKLDKKGAEQGTKIKQLIRDLIFKTSSDFPKDLQITVDVDPIALF